MSAHGHGPHSVPPKIGKWILIALYVSCVVVFGLDFFYEKHGHYAVEGYPGFHAIYGFVCFVGLVLSAIVLRKVVMRDEDYYD